MPSSLATLKSMGYATGQFGKNHLGDLNKFHVRITIASQFESQ